MSDTSPNRFPPEVIAVLFVIATILFLCRCGPSDMTPPDFYTEIGIGVYLDGVTDSGLTADNIDAQVAELNPRLREFGLPLHTTRRAESFAIIHLQPSVYHCPECNSEHDATRWYAGDTLGEHIRIADSAGCPWRSALRHELTHLAQGAAGLPQDFAHARPEWKLVVEDPSITCEGPAK